MLTHGELILTERDIHSICLSALFLGSTSHDLIATFCKSTIQFRHQGLNLAQLSGGMKVPKLFVSALFSVTLIGQFPCRQRRREVSQGESECHLHFLIRFLTFMIVLKFCQCVNWALQWMLQSQSGHCCYNSKFKKECQSSPDPGPDWASIQEKLTKPQFVPSFLFMIHSRSDYHIIFKLTVLLIHSFSFVFGQVLLFVKQFANTEKCST